MDSWIPRDSQELPRRICTVVGGIRRIVLRLHCRFDHARKKRSRAAFVLDISKCSCSIPAGHCFSGGQSRWNGNDQEPIQSNSTYFPRHHVGKEHKQSRLHKENTSQAESREVNFFPADVRQAINRSQQMCLRVYHEPRCVVYYRQNRDQVTSQYIQWVPESEMNRLMCCFWLLIMNFRG